MIVENNQIRGQQTLHYLSKNETTSFRTGRAFSVRANAIERESEKPREHLSIINRQYWKTTIDGELQIRNHRKEPVTLTIRKRFSGEIAEAEASPDIRLLDEGAWSLNRRNELVWAIELAPAEQRTIAYSFTFLAN